MHTCFILDCSSRSTVALNSVLGGFYTSFGSKPFHTLRVCHTKNFIEGSVDYPLSHVGTKYLGDGVVCFSFTSKVEVEESVSVTKLKIVSSIGEEVNMATLSEPFTIDKEGCVHVCAYAQINCEGLTLCSSPERFFEYLYGVRAGTITAKTESGKVEVLVEKTEGKVIISAEVDALSESEKMQFLCDNAPVFYIEAQNQTAETVEVKSIGHLLPRVPFGVEITQIAGGAVILSDIAKRNVGCEVGAPLGFFSPFEFGFEKFRYSPCGNYATFPTVNGWIMLKREANGFVCINFFASYFMQDVIDCCFQNGKLYVLSSSSVKIIDCESGVEEFSSSYNCVAKRIFATKGERILLVGDTLFGCYAKDDLSVPIYQNALTLLACDYDFLTDTFTAISETTAHQYKHAGETYDYVSEAITISKSGFNGISARWGKIVTTYQDRYEVFDLFSKTRSRYTVKGAQNYRCFLGASLLAVATQNGTDVFWLAPFEGEKLFSVEQAVEVFILPTGVIVKDKFYPFTYSFNAFEINSAEDRGEFTILKEVPYFPQETVVLSFEAVA